MGYVIRAVFFPTRVWIAAQAAISSSQRGGGCREWDAVVILKNKKKKRRRSFMSSVRRCKAVSFGKEEFLDCSCWICWEHCSSISHIEADHSLQQSQFFVACTIPLIWLLEEPDKVYWYAVLKLPVPSPPLHKGHIVLLNKAHSHESI